jgi:hypothetical protein
MLATLTVLICLVGVAHTASAQEAEPATVPLQVDVVLTRSKGDTQTSSLPFTLLVNANDRQGNASIRMGVNVPIPTTKDGATSVSYQNVGTQIDCRATSSASGFDVVLSVNDSSLYEAAQGTQGAPSMMGGYPVIRSFYSNTRISIRDGQTLQYTMATDKFSGEVIKVSVTVKAMR